MKKLFLLFAAFLMGFINSTYSQSLMEYISAVKGDTLVIKDYYEMDEEPNSLSYVLLLDTVDVPPGRVYELKANGYYPHWWTPSSSAKRHIVIVGADPTPIVNNKNAESAPPLICNIPYTIDPGPFGINVRGDLTIKNCALVPASVMGEIGWVFAYIDVPDIKVTFDNCLMERTLWVIAAAKHENCNLSFKNCYFVNLSGYPCKRNGGVIDFFAKQDTLLIENCTHVMAQGNLYNFKNYSFNRIIVNHNTFINCAGTVFTNPGYQTNFSLTNNIFINSNVQPNNPSYHELGITDPDSLPIGLVNINPYVNNDSLNTSKNFYVDQNLIYWDPSLSEIDEILNENKINGVDKWQSQMLIMNQRAQGMFNDDANYPFLNEGSWVSKLPCFTESRDLLTTQLVKLKSYVIESADDNSSVLLPSWRFNSTGTENFEIPDWPIPVDLSYSDVDLQVTGWGFPLGDLNWFPANKLQWMVQRDREYASIHFSLYKKYVDVNKENNLSPFKFQLEQNYPNPFNPGTTISFSIPKAGYVSLKVYNILGQEVATLFDGFKNPQAYDISFDGTGLAGGIYFYSLTVSGNQEVRKMILAK